MKSRGSHSGSSPIPDPHPEAEPRPYRVPERPKAAVVVDLGSFAPTWRAMATGAGTAFGLAEVVPGGLPGETAAG